MREHGGCAAASVSSLPVQLCRGACCTGRRLSDSRLHDTPAAHKIRYITRIYKIYTTYQLCFQVGNASVPLFVISVFERLQHFGRVPLLMKTMQRIRLLEQESFLVLVVLLVYIAN